ncbi:MAG TPA: hypothetical protein VN633_05480 [Bryobacteraceae bacterium]|nr:hypothetical protein [Bryobacteraceae bacterium]
MRWLLGSELWSLTLPAPFPHGIRMGCIFIAICGTKGHVYSLAVAVVCWPFGLRTGVAYASGAVSRVSNEIGLHRDPISAHLFR